MAAGRHGIQQMLVGLLTASHLMPLEELPAKVAEYAPAAGLLAVDIYVCDLQESVLRRVTDGGTDAGHGDDESELKIDGTLPGRAFQHGEVLPTLRKRPAGQYQWWVPFLDGTERLGVLRVTTEARSYADDRVMIAGAMEPAYQVAGDAFDFAIAGQAVHLAIFDAMGHDTAAGITANLAVAACRNHRRQGAGLAGTGEAVERVLTEQSADRVRYVTAILADLDTRTGMLEWHGPTPYPRREVEALVGLPEQ